MAFNFLGYDEMDLTLFVTLPMTFYQFQDKINASLHLIEHFFPWLHQWPLGWNELVPAFERQ